MPPEVRGCKVQLCPIRNKPYDVLMWEEVGLKGGKRHRLYQVSLVVVGTSAKRCLQESRYYLDTQHKLWYN